MKRLLLALLVSGTAIFAAGRPSPASADCVQLRYYYYQYPGGPECGLTYVYCEREPVHSGCQTAYYNVYGGCACP